MDEDLMQLDLYEFIGVDPKASIKEIKTSYRKKALSCHPDKNPDNPKAAELFRQLSKVLEILIDDTAKAAYDKVYNARKQAKIRISQLDSKRRKFKEDLEAREEAYKKAQTTSTRTDEQKLKDEIERLKKEGSKLVEEEIAFVKKKIHEQLSSGDGGNAALSDCRVKIKWKAEKDDAENGGYHYQLLHNILSKYGDIVILIMSKKKKGSAMVEYKEKSAAQMAAKIEMGLAKNPLVLKGLWECNDKYSNYTKISSPKFSSSADMFQRLSTQQTRSNDSDFENSVLINMRRAEERKRIIEQMQAEEEKI